MITPLFGNYSFYLRLCSRDVQFLRNPAETMDFSAIKICVYLGRDISQFQYLFNKIGLVAMAPMTRDFGAGECW